MACFTHTLTHSLSLIYTHTHTHTHIHSFTYSFTPLHRNYGYDGRLYVLDTARYMPTEAPTEPTKRWIRGWNLCYLLRPEMVQAIGPQNPDHAIGMGFFESPKKREQERERIKVANKAKRDQGISELCKVFTDYVKQHNEFFVQQQQQPQPQPQQPAGHGRGRGARMRATTTTTTTTTTITASNPGGYYRVWEGLHLREEMHRHGLNMRLLYLLHGLAQRNGSGVLAVVLATEAVARKLKWGVRDSLREHVRSKAKSGEDPWEMDDVLCRQLATLINGMVGCACFQGAKESCFVDPDMLLRRLNDMLGLGLAESVLADGVVRPSDFRGLAAAEPQVKAMNLLPFQTGVALYTRAWIEFSDYAAAAGLPSLDVPTDGTAGGATGGSGGSGGSDGSGSTVMFVPTPVSAPLPTPVSALQSRSQLSSIERALECATEQLERAAGSGVDSFRARSYHVSALQARAKLKVYAGQYHEAWDLLMQADDSLAAFDTERNAVADLSYVVSTRRDIYSLLLRISAVVGEEKSVGELSRKFAQLSDSLQAAIFKNSAATPIQALAKTYERLSGVFTGRWFFGEYETRDIMTLKLQEGKLYFLIRTSPKRPGVFVVTFVKNNGGVMMNESHDITREESGYVFRGTFYQSIPLIVADISTSCEFVKRRTFF